MLLNQQGDRNLKAEGPPRPFVQRFLNSGDKARGERNRLYVKGSFASLLGKQGEKENFLQKMTVSSNVNSNRNLATFRPDPERILAENSQNQQQILYESREQENMMNLKNKSFSRDGPEDDLYRPLNLSVCEARPSVSGRAEVKTRRREPHSPLEERMISLQSEETSTKRERRKNADAKFNMDKRSSSAIGNTNRSLVHSIYQNSLEDHQNERFAEKQKKFMIAELRNIEKKLSSFKETEDEIIRRESQLMDEKRVLLGKHAKLEKRFYEMKTILGDGNRNTRSSRELLSEASMMQDSDGERMSQDALGKKRLQLQQLDLEISLRREELQALENRLSYIKADFDQKESIYLDRLFKLTSRIKNIEDNAEGNKLREENLTEKERHLEKREKELKIFAKKLEQQSEELIAQKIEYQLKHETYNKMLKRLSEEGPEKADSNLLAIAGSHDEHEKFKKLEEQAILKLRHLEAKQKALDEERKMSEAKLRELVKKEGDLVERELQFQEKLSELKKSQEARGEKGAREAHLEKQLQEKAFEINLLKERLQYFEKDDSFELKMMGLKMNEEMHKKKIEIEVRSLKEEWEKIREKEAALTRREINLEKRISESKAAPDEQAAKKAPITTGRLLGGRKSSKLDSSLDRGKVSDGEQNK